MVASALTSLAGAGPLFRGEEDFHKRFPNATEISYKTSEELTFVKFTWEGLKLEAFYDEEGNLLATARFLPFSNLPLSVQLSIRKQYPDYLDTQVIEYDGQDDSVSYYVTEVGLKRSYMLHVLTNGEISIYKKMKN